MPDIPTTPGMLDLVVQLARHRRGLAFVHLADLECAAVTLGVDARIVAQARAALATPEGRADLIAAVRRARADAGPVGPASIPTPTPVAAVAPRTAGELVRSAAEHHYGLEFLREGALESIAVIFQVHPNLVLRARALLERWENCRKRVSGG